MNYRIFTLLSLATFSAASIYAQNASTGSAEKTASDDANTAEVTNAKGSKSSRSSKGSGKDAKDAKDAKDPVLVTQVKFESKKINNDPWIKASVKIRCIENPDAEADELNPDWVRDVTVRLVCAFEDSKTSTASNPKFVWFSTKATLFAMKRNSETVVDFYLPWEAYHVYRLKPVPYGYLVDISANGKNYPINSNNLKMRCNLTGKAAKNFLDRANSNMEANKGVMIPYELLPFAAKMADQPRLQQGNPTYVVE